MKFWTRLKHSVRDSQASKKVIIDQPSPRTGGMSRRKSLAKLFRRSYSNDVETPAVSSSTPTARSIPPLYSPLARNSNAAMANLGVSCFNSDVVPDNAESTGSGRLERIASIYEPSSGLAAGEYLHTSHSDLYVGESLLDYNWVRTLERYSAQFDSVEIQGLDALVSSNNSVMESQSDCDRQHVSLGPEPPNVEVPKSRMRPIHDSAAHIIEDCILEDEEIDADIVTALGERAGDDNTIIRRRAVLRIQKPFWTSLFSPTTDEALQVASSYSSNTSDY